MSTGAILHGVKTILFGFVAFVAFVALLGMPVAARADRVAFVNGQRGLFVVPAEGGKPVQLVPQIDDVNGAAFSPDGARLAVDGGPGNHHGLWLLSVADRSRPPPPELDRGTDPRWSPDGTRIGYGCFLEHQNGEGEERYFSPGGLCVV